MAKEYSQSVGHKMRQSGRTKDTVTHFLLVMGSDVMRLPGRNKAHSLAVGHGMRLLDRTKDTVTHSLLTWD